MVDRWCAGSAPGGAGGSPARCCVPQVAAGPARRAAPRAAGPRRAGSCPRPARSPRAPARLRAPASTIRTSRPGPTPPRNAGDRLERPLRGRQADPLRRRRSGGRSRSSRSRLSARCAPRLVPAIACTSSTITCSTPRSVSRAWLVSIRYRLSGVVTRMSGGCLTSCRRASAGVSPVRDATEISRRSARRAARRRADAGQRRPQVALDVVGQRLERRHVQDADAAGARLPGRRRGVATQPVEAPQEGGQGLAAAGRGVDQRVPARRDRRQPPTWAGVGGLEDALEPARNGGRERRERIAGEGSASAAGIALAPRRAAGRVIALTGPGIYPPLASIRGIRSYRRSSRARPSRARRRERLDMAAARRGQVERCAGWVRAAARRSSAHSSVPPRAPATITAQARRDARGCR